MKSAGNEIKGFIKLSLFRGESERVIPIANNSKRIDALIYLSEKGHRFKWNKIFIVCHTVPDVTIHLDYLSLKRERSKNIWAPFPKRKNAEKDIDDKKIKKISFSLVSVSVKF